MHGLGVETTLVVRRYPLPFIDEDIRSVLTTEMENSGLKMRFGVPHERVEKTHDNRYKVVMQDKSEIVVDKVLAAIGRPPNTEALSLEKANVNVDPKSGLILVDE